MLQQEHETSEMASAAAAAAVDESVHGVGAVSSVGVASQSSPS